MPVLGVVYDVTRDQMYSAAAGQGAWLGDASDPRAPQTPLSDSSMLMMTSNLLTKTAAARTGPAAGSARRTGRSASSARPRWRRCRSAAGVAHGAVTVNGKLWDVAAPAAIVLEAGGVHHRSAGSAIFPFDLAAVPGAKVPFLAAGPAAHEELLAEIRDNP